MNLSFISRRTAVETVTATRLSFKPVCLPDMPLINRFLQQAVCRTCDYSIGGIYMWIDYFRYEYCVVDNTLFLKGVDENDTSRVAFMLPVGALTIGVSVQMILDYCKTVGIRPVFTAVPAERLDDLLAVVGHNAVVQQLRDWSDYVYDIQSLATLTGKHLMKKRNHVNRFFAENPHWRFEALTHEILPETILFYEGQSHPDDPEASPLELYEGRQCRRVLANYSSYPFEGAVLRGESGEIVAFSIGEIIGDTVFVHIEKINHEINGAGAAINKLFAAYMLRRHPALRFANREEDCGDPGLRQAKESYFPTMLLDKYNVEPA
ncbi:MAG: phosphatidylglycerol lysyltransferase domain-containing protein [Odoribacter sp.]|nr:phosphatidylglycerol lysyltransferase domain-containing protein [Odoribacter sp.]